MSITATNSHTGNAKPTGAIATRIWIGEYATGGIAVTAADIPALSALGLYGPQGDDHAVEKGMPVPAATVVAITPTGPATNADDTEAVVVKYRDGVLLCYWTAAASGDAQDAGTLVEVDDEEDLSAFAFDAIVHYVSPVG